jgi:hypothetical protein
MKDSRLIGTWKSDGRKTAKEIAARRDIAASKKVKLRRFFGKLELHYTQSRCYLRLGNYVSVNRYTVVAKDAWSTALVVFDPVAGKQIVHIHFEGEHYWITLGSGRMREFFKRVSSKSTGTRKKTGQVPYHYLTCPVTAFTRHLMMRRRKAVYLGLAYTTSYKLG